MPMKVRTRMRTATELTEATVGGLFAMANVAMTKANAVARP